MALPNLISLTWLVPGVAHKFDNSGAIRGLTGMPRSLLLICHKSASGSLEPLTPAAVLSELDAVAMLGEGSMGLAMWRFARASGGVDLPTYAVLVEEPDGDAAKGAITIDNKATANGTFYLYIAGQLIRVAVSDADSADDIAQSIVLAINAETDLPVTAVVNGSQSSKVDLTCKWKGDTGNQVDIRINYEPGQQLPRAMQVSVTAMANGTGSPDLTDLFTAIANERYTEFVNPFTDAANIRTAETDMADRWQHDHMQDMQMVCAISGTVGEIGTWADTVNHQCGHSIGLNNSPTPTWCIAAAAGALIETQAGRDPAVPFRAQELVGVLPPKSTEQFEPTQQNMLLAQGISTVMINNGRCYIDRIVTHYTKHQTGADDASYRNLNWVKTLSYWRWFCVNEFRKKTDYKMASALPVVPAGHKIMTPQRGEEFMIGLYQQFVNAALFQDPEGYRNELLCEVDEVAGRLKIQDKPRLITQHYQTEITSQYRVGAQ